MYGRIMERESLKCFEEKEHTLACSTKKFKENHTSTKGEEVNPFRSVRSYRDKQLGEIQGAFEQAFGLSNDMEEDAESNIEEDAESNIDEDKNVDGNMVVCLTKEEKTCIRVVWR